MDKFSDLLSQRLQHHQLKVAADAATILFEANQLLLTLFQGFDHGVQAYRYADGVLFLAGKNASVNQEVWFLQSQILAHLQSHFGLQVKKIRIKHLTTP